MKLSSLAKRLGALSLTLALGAGMVACSGGDNAPDGGAVAATVNGQDIMEQTVTDYVADFRKTASLETDEAWGQWLVSNGYTPESVRTEVIDYYINQDLYEQAATEYNVAVEQADIDEALSQTKSMFESEEAFQQALEASNMTEDSYVETVIKPNLLQNKLSEAVAAATADGNADEAMLQQAQSMADSWNGAKKSSHILFSVEDEATAQQVLDQLKNGEITFEDAAKQYSTDTSGQEGGNVGWDKLTSFVTEYQDALNGLEKEQMTETLVKTDFGYHIIKCTDVFTVPEGGITSLDQLPAEFQQYLTYMQQTNATSNFSTWFAEYRENAEININPMPEGLPYDIDLTPYDNQNAQDAASAAGDQPAQDATAGADEAATPEADADQAAAEADQAAADQAAAETDQAAADQQTAEGDVPEAGADQAAADGEQVAADEAADQAAADQAAADQQAAEGDQAQ